jgi:hypothetical protein
MDLKDRGLCTLRVLVLVLEDPCFKFLLFTPTGLIAGKAAAARPSLVLEPWMTTRGHTNDVAHQRHASAVRPPPTRPLPQTLLPWPAARSVHGARTAQQSALTVCSKQSTGPHAYAAIPQLGAFPLTELRVVVQTT